MAVTRPRRSAFDRASANDAGRSDTSERDPQEDRLVALLRARGHRPRHLPTTRIAPPDDPGPLREALRGIADYDWLVVTSARAVPPLLETLRPGEAATQAPARVCAVGPRTASALRRAGFEVDLIPERFIAEGVVDALLEERSDLAGVRVLLPRAEEGRDIIPGRLRDAGATVDVVTAYRTVPDPEGAGELGRIVQAGEIDVLTFAAGSAVRAFAAAWGTDGAREATGVRIAVIGPATGAVVETEGWRVDRVADPHTLEGLADAVASLAEQDAE